MGVAADVHVEAMMLRQGEGRAAEVPLADVDRLIAAGPERLCQRLLLERQAPHEPGGPEFGVGVPAARGHPIGEHQPSRILAGEDRGPGRRTDGTSGVGVSEPGAGPGQGVGMRSAVKVAAVTAHVPPAEVVDEKHDHIPKRICGRHRNRSERDEACEPTCHHKVSNHPIQPASPHGDVPSFRVASASRRRSHFFPAFARLAGASLAGSRRAKS